MTDKVDIGNLATWVLSTYKPGMGVEELRDGNLETFWQSDGPLPHYLTLRFPTLAFISHISLFLDFKNDESYTPSRFAVFAGYTAGDLEEVRAVEVDEPCGWVEVDVRVEGREGERRPLRAHMLQLAVLANHANGKDAHVRLVRVFGPRR
ncbi:galactose-binding like protein [Gonapodya prolifera JEL478]|uniref:Galactose-binding like protein n=1 Tax=Gonapodya prolifera (strain JEL478) TaxID=1344416 RepID=A0A139A862_GONPJ|nr:galactose-binding like protein [Gonapodya prolifera JEL478]|eukprot:KXS13001.1 galactose-binding like protein [Gonapodya prolifera JEL478]